MIPAGFGIVRTGMQALRRQVDELDPDRLDPDDLASMWRASSELCRAADDINNRLRTILVDRVGKGRTA